MEMENHLAIVQILKNIPKKKWYKDFSVSFPFLFAYLLVFVSLDYYTCIKIIMIKNFLSVHRLSKENSIVKSFGEYSNNCFNDFWMFFFCRIYLFVKNKLDFNVPCATEFFLKI